MCVLQLTYLAIMWFSRQGKHLLKFAFVNSRKDSQKKDSCTLENTRLIKNMLVFEK